MPMTQFGEDCGVDVDEIAVSLHNIPDRAKVWMKITKRNKGQVSKQTEIYKILYALVVMVNRKKNPRSKKPPAEPIKKLTTMLCRKLPRKKGKTVLEKEYFVNPV